MDVTIGINNFNKKIMKKKINLTGFKKIQLSVSQLSKIKGGCGYVTITNTIGDDTSSSGSDKDSGCSDWD